MLQPNLKPESDKNIVSLVAPAATATGATSASEEPAKQQFPPPAELPTQVGPEGVRFDYNFGARVIVPESGAPWRVRLSDLDTGNVLFETTLPDGLGQQQQALLPPRAGSRFFWATAWCWRHDYDCRDKEVLIQLPVGTLGDSLGWFPYAVKFQRPAAAA